MAAASPRLNELLDHFTQRMRFVHLVTALTRRSRPEQIKSLVPDEDELTNLIMAVLVFIMDRTLRDNDRCTLKDVEAFLEELCPCVNLELDEYGTLARYILVTVLQNGGKLQDFPVIDIEHSGFSRSTFQMVNEVKGCYQLTDQVYEFLFRTRELDDEYEFSVTRFKLQESLKRSRYQDALAQSQELINRIRSMKRNLDSFLFRCRENIASVPVDEFERVVKRVHALLEEEEEPLLMIQEMSERRLQQIQQGGEAFPDPAKLTQARRAIQEIIGNITTTIQEQRSLINRRSNMARQYQKLVQEQMGFRSVQRYSIEEELMRPFWSMEKGNKPLESFANFLFFPLCKPTLPTWFSLENLYAPQSQGAERERQEGMLLQSEESLQEQLIRERDHRHEEIIRTLFTYAAKQKEYTLSDYWDSLTSQQQTELCRGNALLQVLLQLYETGSVQVGEWKRGDQSVFEPNGEFELGWCLPQLSDELLDMEELRITGTEETCELLLGETERRRIVITDFRMEVIRA